MTQRECRHTFTRLVNLDIEFRLWLLRTTKPGGCSRIGTFLKRHKARTGHRECGPDCQQHDRQDCPLCPLILNDRVVLFTTNMMNTQTPDGSCQGQSRSTFLSLPAEIRLSILEYVFEYSSESRGFKRDPTTQCLEIDPRYTSSFQLQPLLVCRQFNQDCSRLGIRQTTFFVGSLFGDIQGRLSLLRPTFTASLRHITFVADARQFRELTHWKNHAFNLPDLQLDDLTIVLHRSSFWHFLFDYTDGIVTLLRSLQNVKRLIIVRNNARVKGSLKTWYNRLVGLIMKVDHRERYEKSPPNMEKTWWEWTFDDVAQSLSLEARQAKPIMEEEMYMRMILPIMEKLRISVENEEWNPDPRSRQMYY